MALSIVAFTKKAPRVHGQHNKALALTFIFACLPHAKATTEWALSDSITVIAGADIYSVKTPDAQIVTEQAFKSHYASNPSDPFNTEILMDLGSSKTVKTANVINQSNNLNASMKMGNSAFYITDDASTSAVYTKCSDDFHDGGSFVLTNCQGRYLKLMRTGSGMHNPSFSVNEIRVFSVPNLLEGAAVLKAPAPKDQDS